MKKPIYFEPRVVLERQFLVSPITQQWHICGARGELNEGEAFVRVEVIVRCAPKLAAAWLRMLADELEESAA